MWQLAEAIRGLADACQVLRHPGHRRQRVALQRRTRRRRGHPPDPGGRRARRDRRRRPPPRRRAGRTARPSTCSAHACGARRLGMVQVVHGHLGGLPPEVDLDAERRLAEILIHAIRDGMVDAAHDLSEGGLIQALIESSLRFGVGVQVSLDPICERDGVTPFEALFSESTARVLVAVPRSEEVRLVDLCTARGVPTLRLGETAESCSRAPAPPWTSPTTSTARPSRSRACSPCPWRRPARPTRRRCRTGSAEPTWRTRPRNRGVLDLLVFPWIREPGAPHRRGVPADLFRVVRRRQGRGPRAACGRSGRCPRAPARDAGPGRPGRHGRRGPARPDGRRLAARGRHRHRPQPRTTALVRDTAGATSRVQALAANIDMVLVVEHLDPDPSSAASSGCYPGVAIGRYPVVVLTKADLVPDPDDGMAAEVAAVALAVDVHTVSVPTDQGLDALRALLVPGATLVAVGPSGAGKSTLVNALAGHDDVETGGRRADGRGRHTTTHRELVPLAGGAMLIDTPGIRGVGVVADAAALDTTFAGRRGAGCGVPVRRLPPRGGAGLRDPGGPGQRRAARRRFDSWRRLGQGGPYQARRSDVRLRAEERDRWKKITMSTSGAAAVGPTAGLTRGRGSASTSPSRNLISRTARALAKVAGVRLSRRDRGASRRRRHGAAPTRAAQLRLEEIHAHPQNRHRAARRRGRRGRRPDRRHRRTAAQAATGCKVEYRITNQWAGGFGADVSVTNLGDPVSSWTVGWTFARARRSRKLWNGTASTSGSAVSVASLPTTARWPPAPGRASASTAPGAARTRSPGRSPSTAPCAPARRRRPPH